MRDEKPEEAPGRRSSLAALLLLTALLAGCGGGGRAAAPSVILVVVDTLRADHLPDYGYARDTVGDLAPFLRRFVRFAHAWAPAPMTVPSVASVLSGLHPARHLAGDSTNLLNPSIATLAEVLGQAGWETGGFSFNLRVSRRTRFDQGFERFTDYQGGRFLAYPDISEMVEPTRRWVGARRRPFFLYLQPMNVHGPYSVPAGRRSVLLGRPPGRGFAYLRPPMSAILGGVLEARSRVDRSYLESLEDQYDTAVRYTMDTLAGLFRWLESAGRFEESLIIVTSDHGEELFDHGGFSHGYSLFEEVLRVPLYVKLPGESGAAVVRERVSLIDLYPTILDVVGLPPPYRLDGRSLLPLLAGARAGVGAGAAWDRELLFAIRSPRRCTGRALLSGPFKLIEIEQDYQQTSGLLLHRIASDPEERYDLAADEPELVARLGEGLERAFESYRRRALPAPGEADAELDAETLRALGYL